MYKFLITIFISSILHFTHANNHCTDDIKVLDPSIGLGTYNCTELGKYQRNGCKRIINSGIVCILVPKKIQKTKDCYHCHCKWSGENWYTMEISVVYPYDKINILSIPNVDTSPTDKLILTCIFLPVFTFVLLIFNGF